MEIRPYDYTYPEELVALQPQEPCRILDANQCREINKAELFDLFLPGDLLIINNSKVEKRRVITDSGLEILFLQELNPKSFEWEVLFPARGLKIGDEIAMPEGLKAKLIEKGIPQKLQLLSPLPENYFERVGELALPPYIQSARKDRHNWKEDERWYQTAWAKNTGSVASPTASLHFTQEDLGFLKSKGVLIEEVTLHVGAGTFLPIRTENLKEHVMHSEEAEISTHVIDQIEKAKASGQRVWALGTTACRTVESWAQGLLKYDETSQSFRGETDLFIYPGYEWKAINALLTNFHQPKTTLLSLVESFAGKDRLQKAYEYAIAHKFRLFSYGDLSIWSR